MKNCSNCGAEMQDDVKFCPACGAAQNVEQPAGQQAQQPQYGAPQQPYYGQAQYGAPQQQPYYGQPQQPYYAPQAPVKPTSAMAIIGLITAILSLVVGCYLGVIGIVFGAVGVVLSAIGLAKKDKYRAPGIAIAGLVVACVGLLISIMITAIIGYLGIATPIEDMLPGVMPY